MNWQKLRDYKCPQCDKMLTNNVAKKKNHLCMNCHFTIGDEKFNKIVSDLYNPQKRRCKIELVSENEQALSEL